MALGLFLGLGLLKFGNPVILASRVKPPDDVWEFLIGTWPLPWGYVLLALILMWGMLLAFLSPGFHPGSDSPRSRRCWLVWLPLGWFGWQCVSAAQTASWPLTQATLWHFAAATACFYLGRLALARAPSLIPMWGGILVGFIGVVAVGFDQHFGGLEATRKFFYSQPDWQNHSPEMLRKIASDRIYSTLFYPNTLAGVILVFLPALVAITLQLSRSKLKALLLSGCVGFGGLACLFWSGSKAGWLIGLVVALVAWARSGVTARMKWVVGLSVTAVALAVFAGKHTAYFEKGATSVGARFDYWSAAVRIASKHPVLGSGPGTFSVLYRYLKSPDSEMARLVHNDYLEQASDSGLPGFILFGLLIFGHLITAGKRLTDGSGGVAWAVWLGLLGWALQSFVEFGLYIPALAWPVFLFLGWLSGLPQELGRIQIDSPDRTR